MLGARMLPGLAVLGWLGCTPTEIAEEQFQSRQQTCYEFPESADGGAPVQASFWSDTHRREGCNEEQAVSAATTGAGNAGSGSAAVTGAVGAATPPEPPAPTSADTATAGGGALISGDAGTATPSGPSQSAGPLPAGCQEADILARFARPSTMGGCTDPDGLGCHEDGTGEAPFMGHPTETIAKLLDQQDADGCGEVWIPSHAKKPEDSFLYRRLSQNVSDEDCEVQMPLMEEPLDPATLQCIGAWIVWVANGRQP
jgi:hypothetical protein